jgi:hypothetical protein
VSILDLGGVRQYVMLEHLVQWHKSCSLQYQVLTCWLTASLPPSYYLPHSCALELMFLHSQGTSHGRESCHMHNGHTSATPSERSSVSGICAGFTMSAMQNAYRMRAARGSFGILGRFPTRCVTALIYSLGARYSLDARSCRARRVAVTRNVKCVT